MSRSAEKTTRTTSATIQRQAANVSVQRAALAPVRPAVQAKLTVNQPGDALEREADAMADRVTQSPGPPPANLIRLERRTPDRTAQRKDVRERQEPAPLIQRRESGAGTPEVTPSVQSAIEGQASGGAPLAGDVRGAMESRFGADFSSVRVHTGEQAASLSNQLSARAFTYQNHIFFSRGQYQPDTSGGQHLLAHELTHTIQQGHATQDAPQVSTAASAPSVQRLGLQDALDTFAGWANAIPGFRLLTIVLGFNPISRRSVDRSAANILRGLIELLPGGFIISQVLDNYGVINRAAAWLEQQLAELGDIGGAIVDGLRRFLDSLSWTDIFDLSGVWERAKRIFTEPIGRLIAFGGRVAVEILRMVKDAVLRPLAALAQGTRGYDLLRAILGQDPISGEPVPRSAENLLGGFMKLIGQDEIWENIKKGNAIARAWAWFQSALEGLMGLVRAIPGRIVSTITSLTFQDIVTLAGAFTKIAGNFLSIAVDFAKWGLGTIWNLLEIIFDVVKPGLMGYVRRTGAALRSILRNPFPFLGHLVNAAKLGFSNFTSNFGEHLKQGLIDWLTGSLEGVYIPRAMTLGELGKFALSVLGISWAQIRGKIVRGLGPRGETIMQGLETAFDVVKTLVTGGLSAAWELIKERLTELKDQVVSGIISMVTSTIIQKAIPKLISMFIPGAGFISAIVSIYDTVMVFVEKIARIIQVVTAFIDSIVTIAAGNITAAAARVERVLAGLLSLSISFLAGFIGLGRIADKVMGVINRVRASVDRAIDAAVNWVLGRVRAFAGAIKAGARRLFEWWKKRVPVDVGGEHHSLEFEGEAENAHIVIRSEPERPSEFLERRHSGIEGKKPKKGKFVENTVKQEDKIDKARTSMPGKKGIESDTEPLTGEKRKKADKAMESIDEAVQEIAAIIPKAFKDWKLEGANEKIEEKDLSLKRGKFPDQVKLDLVTQHRKEFADLTVEGKLIPGSKIRSDGGFKKGAKLHRRHIVSSKDMIDHYNDALLGKSVHEARVLVSERSSIKDARINVAGDTKSDVMDAVGTRYNRFFSYLNNLFIGGAETNTKLQENLDRFHPVINTKKMLKDHIARIKREWAFSPSMTISGEDVIDTIQ